MKISELIEVLKGYDPELLVYMSCGCRDHIPVFDVETIEIKGRVYKPNDYVGEVKVFARGIVLK